MGESDHVHGLLIFNLQLVMQNRVISRMRNGSAVCCRLSIASITSFKNKILLSVNLRFRTNQRDAFR